MTTEKLPILPVHAAVEIRKLGKALAELASEYPIDSPDAETALLSLTAADGEESPRPGHLQFREETAVRLQPGHLQWLTQLVERELANNRNAHSDGTGRCGHCEGTGKAYPTGPITHVVAWSPGELLAEDPDMDAWEIFGIEAWENGGTGDWLLGPETVTTDQRATAEQLHPLVVDMLRTTGPIRLVPRAFTIESVGDPGTPHSRTGPWTYPRFDVVALTPAAPEQGTSQPSPTTP
ncbi:hypothetical protein ACFQ7A_04915 [Streptomyces sp. NPDC056528]|uniref:hypothetical protein n=1 Tax=Streptomyces sp. NPDC056528 TaxID=3345854 RepID=UPI0036B2863A